MKNLVLIKTLPYDPRQDEDQDMFSGYCCVTLQKFDPCILEQALAHKTKSEAAFVSSARRAQDTARAQGYTKLQETTLLNEVLFDLESLLTKEEFVRSGSSIVRERFVQAFVANRLLEPRAQLKARVRAVVQLAKGAEEQVVTCFSHSFFMKLVEAYVKTGGRVFDEPELLAKFMPPSQPTYPYGKGVTLKI